MRLLPEGRATPQVPLEPRALGETRPVGREHTTGAHPTAGRGAALHVRPRKSGQTFRRPGNPRPRTQGQGS